MLFRRYTYIISYAVHSHFLLANIICLIYRYIYVYHTNIYIPSITIHTMLTPMYIIIPSTLHTYVYIFSTYSLQECVCFRKHPHTAPEQQSNTNTEKNNITYKFIQVKRVSDLYTHRLIALIVLYIPILYQLTTIIIVGYTISID